MRDAFVACWKSYAENAWGRDELKPVSGVGKDGFGGWAATAIDAMDTLWIMGFKEDFEEAVKLVAELDWSVTQERQINIFETTIRHLGGLLSVYDLSGEAVLLTKAKELGDMLYQGFDTPNRLPGFWLNFADAQLGRQKADTHEPSASPGSLSMEFTRLSQLTGDPKYFDAVDRITSFLKRTQSQSNLPGMWPLYINLRDEVVEANAFSLGALADSLYEYLIKMHALLGGLDASYAPMWKTAMNAAKIIVYRPMLPDNNDILFTGEVLIRHQDRGRKRAPKSQHLACFAGAMYALGGKLLDMPEHVITGEKLTRGCAYAYSAFPSGLMPEEFRMIPCPTLDECAWDEERWQKKGNAKLPKGFREARDRRYMLRPEAIESLFVLYRITGKKDLQDLAWDMFTSIMNVTTTEFGNSAIQNVAVKGGGAKTDSMEVSFTFAFV